MCARGGAAAGRGPQPGVRPCVRVRAALEVSRVLLLLERSPVVNQPVRGL